MKLLFDTGMKEMNKQITSDRNQINKKLAKIKEQTSDAIQMSDSIIQNKIEFKFQKLEQFVDGLVFDIAKL